MNDSNAQGYDIGNIEGGSQRCSLPPTDSCNRREIFISDIERRHGFRSALANQIRPIDLALLSVVPALLIGISLLPQSVKLDFVLAYLEPTIVTTFTSHFVHLNSRHLLINLGLYTIVLPMAYGLSLLSYRRGSFLMAFVIFVVGFPFVLSVLNLLFPRPRIGFGFSGIIMAFVGYHSIVLCEFAGQQLGLRFDHHRAPVLFFAVVILIIVRVIPPSNAAIWALGLATLGCGVYLHAFLDGLPTNDPGLLNRVVNRPGYGEMAFVGIGVVMAVPFVAFPHTPVGEGTVTNLYTHFLGYALGFLVSYIVMSGGSRVGWFEGSLLGGTRSWQ